MYADELRRRPDAGHSGREICGRRCRGARAEEPAAREGLQPARGRRRRDRRGAAVVRRSPHPDAGEHRTADHEGSRRRQDGAARGWAGDAAGRRPRHVPVHHVLQCHCRRSLHRLGIPPTRIDCVNAAITVCSKPLPSQTIRRSPRLLRTSAVSATLDVAHTWTSPARRSTASASSKAPPLPWPAAALVAHHERSRCPFLASASATERRPRRAAR